MIYRASKSLVVVLLLLFSSSSFAQTASDPSISSSLQQILDSEFASQSALGKSFAVVFPDESVWTGVAGMSDPTIQDPIRPDHQFGFASITKTFIAAAALKLVEEGKLDLEDRISAWLSPMTYVNSGITVRQLLGHTSGLYNFTNYANLIQVLLADTSHVYTPAEVLSTFLGPPAFFAGTDARYSNSNYIMLDMIIEAAAGEPIGSYLKSNVFAPAELMDTVYPVYESPRGELATAWYDYSGDGVADNFSGFFSSTSLSSTRGAAGSIISTATDIAKWGAALYGANILAPTSKSEMLTFHNLSGQNATWTGYGLGAQRYNFGGVEAWGHSGLVTGETSLLVYSPELDVSIAMVDNNAASNHFSSALALFNYLSSVTLTGVDQEEFPTSSTPDVFPNPGIGSQKTYFEIASSDVHADRLTVFDALGREVYSSEFSRGTRVEWEPSSETPSGVYFYHLSSDQGTISSGSFLRIQ